MVTAHHVHSSLNAHKITLSDCYHVDTSVRVYQNGTRYSFASLVNPEALKQSICLSASGKRGARSFVQLAVSREVTGVW